MTLLGTQDMSMGIRLLNLDNSESSASRRSFDTEGLGIRIFEWTIAILILMILFSIIKREIVIMGESENDNENSDATNVQKNPEEEEKRRKTIVLGLFKSQKIQRVRTLKTNRIYSMLFSREPQNRFDSFTNFIH